MDCKLNITSPLQLLPLYIYPYQITIFSMVVGICAVVSHVGKGYFYKRLCSEGQLKKVIEEGCHPPLIIHVDTFSTNQSNLPATSLSELGLCTEPQLHCE